MRILTPNDDDFNFEQCENLYNEIAEYIGNSCSFKDLVYNSHFYSFYDEDNFIGCLYVTNENEKLFFSGFSKRKTHKFNIEAVKKVLTFYNCDIYSKTKNKTAEFLLKKCGFKLIGSDASELRYYKKEK